MPKIKPLPRLEPVSRAILRVAASVLVFVGGPVLVWVFVIRATPGGGIALDRLPRMIFMTALMFGLFWVLLVGVLRGQGLLPLVRWREVNGEWRLRFANELVGWRTIATVKPGVTIELTQRDNTPSWARVAGVKASSPYRRCAVQVTAPGVDTEVHVALQLHRRYVEGVQQAMTADGLDVAFTFRSLVRPVSPFEARGE